MKKKGYSSKESVEVIKSLEKNFPAPYMIIGWSKIGGDEASLEAKTSKERPLYYTLKDLYFGFRKQKKTGRYGIFVAPCADSPGKSEAAFAFDTQIAEKAFKKTGAPELN